MYRHYFSMRDGNNPSFWKNLKQKIGDDDHFFRYSDRTKEENARQDNSI